jgi:hypothetical protein
MGGNDYTILLVAALTVAAAFIIWVFVMTISGIVSSVIAFLLQITADVFINEPIRKLREKRKKKKFQG